MIWTAWIRRYKGVNRGSSGVPNRFLFLFNLPLCPLFSSWLFHCVCVCGNWKQVNVSAWTNDLPWTIQKQLWSYTGVYTLLHGLSISSNTYTLHWRRVEAACFCFICSFICLYLFFQWLQRITDLKCFCHPCPYSWSNCPLLEVTSVPRHHGLHSICTHQCKTRQCMSLPALHPRLLHGKTRVLLSNLTQDS